MYKRLKIALGIFLLISFQGCGLTRLLDPEFRKDAGILQKLGTEFEQGKPDYYTKEEKQQQYAQFLKDMQNIREMSKKYQD
tara:strand:- start:486 stop:728 length:243 start_codon:yes stop_codon:yes gene_type:complete